MNPVWQASPLVAFSLCLRPEPDCPPAVKGLAGLTAAGLGCLAYAGLYEVNAFRLRRFEVPVLPAGASLHPGAAHL